MSLTEYYVFFNVIVSLMHKERCIKMRRNQGRSNSKSMRGARLIQTFTPNTQKYCIRFNQN